MPYTTTLTGQEIDNALKAASQIRKNSGIPESLGNGEFRFVLIDSVVRPQGGGIPTSGAVYEAIRSRAASFFTFRGSVPNASELPQNPAVGDVWHVADGNQNVAWNGTQWDDLGSIGTFDITPESIGAVSTQTFGNMDDRVKKLEDGITKQQVTDALGYTPDKPSLTFSATIRSIAWQSSGDIFKATVAVSGILAADTAFVDIAANTAVTKSEREALAEAWGTIAEANILNGSVEFYALERPAMDIPVKIACLRKGD